MNTMIFTKKEKINPESKIVYIVIHHKYGPGDSTPSSMDILSVYKRRAGAWNCIQKDIELIWEIDSMVDDKIIDHCKIDRNGFTIFYKAGHVSFYEISPQLLK